VLGALSPFFLLGTLLVFAFLRSRDARSLLWRSLTRRSEPRDFAAAEGAAGRSGRVFRTGEVTVWTDIPGVCERDIQGCVRDALGRLSAATGFSPVLRRPLRVLLFERADDARTYLGRENPLLGGAGTVLLSCGWLCRRSVGCGFTSDDFGPRFSESLAWHVIRDNLRGRIAWLEFGLPSIVGGEPVVTTRIGDRRISLADVLAEEAFFTGSEMLSLSLKELARLDRSEEARAGTKPSAVFALQAAAFVRFLADSHGAAFRRFLAQAGRARWPAGPFRECLGASPDDLMKAWIGTLRADGARPPPKPEEALHSGPSSPSAPA
jgi:hypothetical protein